MSDKIRVLIVDDLPETRENVRKLLQFESDVEVIAQAGTGEQAVEMAKEHQPDIILMDINMPGLDGIGASQAIVQSVPSAQIVIMSVQSEADYLRRAMLAGARDFLMKPFSGDELIAAIRRVHQMRPATTKAAPARKRTPAAVAEIEEDLVRLDEGRIITVYSPKGGSGCTTLAANLAVSLADEGYSTLLIDGSLQFGDVGVMLDLKPATTIADLMDRIGDLDSDLVSSVVVSHSSGLNVLMAPPRPEMADLVTESGIKALLEYLRQEFEYVVIDTSSSLNDVALAMLDMSDRVFLITQQSMPALKNASRFFDLANTLSYEREKIVLLVNRSSNKLGISVKDVTNALKRPVVITVPEDEDAVTRATDQGRPLVLGRTRNRPISRAIRDLAEYTVNEFKPEKAGERQGASREPKKVSFWKRLFGRSSQVAG